MSKLATIPVTPVVRVHSILSTNKQDKQKLFNSAAEDARNIVIECLRFLQNDWGGGTWRLLFDACTWTVRTSESLRTTWNGSEVEFVFDDLIKGEIKSFELTKEQAECLAAIVLACAHIADKDCLNAGAFVQDAKLVPMFKHREAV